MTGLPGLVVDAELGDSVIYEAYSGDLALARAAAERAVASAGGRERGRARLALAVVHLLQGSLRSALQLLDQVEQDGPDPALAFRAVTYRRLATEMSWRLFPDLSGAGGAEWEVRAFDFVPVTGSLSARRQALAPSAGEAARLEALLVDLISGSLFARRILSNPDAMPLKQRKNARALAFDVPLGFHKEATALGASPALLANASRLAAHLSHLLGDERAAARSLQESLAHSGQAGDDVGAACSHMLYGDWQCTAVGSPLVLDHHLQEGAQSDALGWAEESLEFGLRARPVVTGQRLDAAAVAYDRTAELFGRAGAPRGKAAVELRRGFLAERRGNLTQAFDLAQAAAQEFDRLGDVLGSWAARAHSAVRRIGLGWLGEDRETAEALGAWGAGDGSFPYALGLGLVFAREGRRWLIRDGDYERALACFRLAEATFAALGALQNMAMALADQAEAYAAVGEAAFALPAFDKAFAALADVAITMGQRTGMPWARALALGASAHNMATRAMDPDLMARTAERLGRLLTAPPSAGVQKPVATVAVAGARSAVELNPVLIPLYRGQLARRAGRAADAEDFFAEALRQAEAMTDPSQREFRRASVLATCRRYGEAAQAYRRYTAMRTSSTPTAEERLFKVMQRMLGDSARQQGGRLRRAMAHEEDAAFFTAVRAYQEAEAEFAQLRELQGDRWWMSSPRPWELMAYLGEVAEGLGRAEEAVAWYEEAIGLLEARRALLSRDELKMAISGGGAELVYFRAARACLALAGGAEAAGDDASAAAWAARGFDYAERGKARALLDLMSATAPTGTARAPRGDPQPGADVALLTAQWRSVSARLAAYLGLQRAETAGRGPSKERLDYLAARIATAESELRDTEAKLARVAPGFRRAVNPQAEVIDAADVPAALSPGTVLLEYFYLGEDFLAWAFTPDGPPRFARATIDAAALSLRIRALHQACQGGAPAGEAAGDLAALFLKPFTSLIDHASHVLVVPHGAAHVLPLAALPWDGQPLIASRSVSTLPSASALRFLAARRAEPLGPSVLAVGNPAGMSRRTREGRLVPCPPLPGAAVEAAAVAGMFSPHGTALIGPAATVAAVRAKARGQDIIHLATHGYLSEEAPLLSAVLLAEGQELAVYELVGLEVDASLVVLSACRTALGETTAGDDVLGLSRGLLAAGAGGALVTLWPVEDISTCLLMQDFYQRLRNGEPPAAALRGAQNRLRTMGAADVAAALAALPAALAEPSAPPGGSAGPARDALDEDLQNEVRIRGGERSADYRHPRHWAPFVLVSPG